MKKTLFTIVGLLTLCQDIPCISMQRYFNWCAQREIQNYRSQEYPYDYNAPLTTKSLKELHGEFDTQFRNAILMKYVALPAVLIGLSAVMLKTGFSK